MRKNNHFKATLFSLLFIFSFGSIGCGGEGEGGVGVEYKPIGIPLKISIDSKGEISFEASDYSLPTPIGTFTATFDISFPNKKVLSIVVAEKKHVYDLGRNRFKVEIPNDRNNQSSIEYDGSGNIMVIIPNPVWDNFSGLANPKPSETTTVAKFDTPEKLQAALIGKWEKDYGQDIEFTHDRKVIISWGTNATYRAIDSSHIKVKWPNMEYSVTCRVFFDGNKLTISNVSDDWIDPVVVGTYKRGFTPNLD